MAAVIVDPEFHALIPPLTPDEYAQLEKNLLADGCRDALITWNGILLDGHNRLEICTRHDLPFSTLELPFVDRLEAKMWIIHNQLGRRNLSPYQRTELAFQLEPAIKEKAKQNLSDGGKIGAEITNRGCQISDKAVQSVDTKKELAQIAGVSHDTIAKARAISEKADDATKEKLRKGETSINAVYKEIQKADRKAKQHKPVETPVFPKGVYSIILADPPWRYEFSKDSADAIENHYPTMSLDQLCEMDISGVLAKDAVLFMWATAPKLPEALLVMAEWGFHYKTSAVWDKEWIGMGYWFRGEHELLLVGTRGAFSPPVAEVRVSSIIREKRTGHSKKPERIYEIIETYFPALSKLELFQRPPGRPGWDSWGVQV